MTCLWLCALALASVASLDLRISLWDVPTDWRIVTSFGSASTPQDSSLVQQLVAAEAELWNAWKIKDTTYYRRTMLPDAVFVSGSGISTRDQTIQQVIRFSCTVDSTTLDHPSARSLPAGSGMLTVHAVVAYTCNGTPRSAAVWSSTAFVRQGREWRIAFHQESSEPSPASRRSAEPSVR